MQSDKPRLVSRRLNVLIALLCAFVALPAVAGQPRNVILCIGDGMGFEHVKAAGMYLYGHEYGTPGHVLSFETLPFRAEVTTLAPDGMPDSASAGTAIATGVKVNDSVVSVAIPGDGRNLETILEYYQARGRATGLITTTYMTHATPAVFAAHTIHRRLRDEIAAWYLQSTRPNVLFGGGGYGMSPVSAAAAGYTVVTDRAGLLGLNPNAETMVSGQFGVGFMPFEYDGDYSTLPHLREMTAAALEILDNAPGGFFLMLEGGLIDTAAHDNHLARCIGETVEFARGVQAVIDWAAGRSDTLILVTADHETGGLRVVANNGAGVLPTVTWGSQDHTLANVPLYAWGVNAERVTGVLDNTQIFAIAVRSAPAAADLDGDEDVDLADFGLFQTCFNGPNRPAGAPNCDNADLDDDGDIDLDDFSRFQTCFNGANQPAACL